MADFINKKFDKLLLNFINQNGLLPIRPLLLFTQELPFSWSTVDISSNSS